MFARYITSVSRAISSQDGTHLARHNPTMSSIVLGPVLGPFRRIVARVAGAQLRELLHINNPDASAAVHEVTALALYICCTQSPVL